ncbi:MAG: hypothetical protein GY765_36550, partial [bacterium]|nr:hypothetical protein [bacterium]
MSTNSKSVLFLFTGSYPYKAAAEDTFLQPELEHLVTAFDEIVIVPSNTEGERGNYMKELKVEDGFSKYVFARSVSGKIKRFFRALKSPLFYKEISGRPSLLAYPNAIKRLIAFTSIALFTRDWVLEYIKTNNIDVSRTLFYTYWFDAIALGIGLAKRAHREKNGGQKAGGGIKVISRAHRYDVYFECYSPPFIPLRAEAIEVLDVLYIISKMGLDYTQKMFPQFKD